MVVLLSLEEESSELAWQGLARSVASPVYLEDVLKGSLAELVADLTAVNAVVGNPLCWDLYLVWGVVE